MRHIGKEWVKVKRGEIEGKTSRRNCTMYSGSLRNKSPALSPVYTLGALFVFEFDVFVCLFV